MRILQFAFEGGSGNATCRTTTSPTRWSMPARTTTTRRRAGGTRSTSASARRAAIIWAAPAHEIHWDLIRAACASVADTVVHPMQDVLGLGGVSTA